MTGRLAAADGAGDSEASVDDRRQKQLSRKFTIEQMHALRCQAEIISGAFKNRPLQTARGVPMPEDQKLDRTVQDLRQHIRNMEEIAAEELGPLTTDDDLDVG